MPDRIDNGVYRNPPSRHVRQSAPIAPKRGKRRMKGVISTFTPEWRSIFHTTYGKPLSNVSEAFSRRRTLSVLPCTRHTAQPQALEHRSPRVLGLR